MNNRVTSKFWQETQRLLAEPVPGITAVPDEANSRYFHVKIAGPQDVSRYGILAVYNVCLV